MTQDPACSGGDPPELRTLPTSRGDFILRWSAAEMSYLLDSHGLAPADLATGCPASTRALARDLFLLGLADDLSRPGPRRQGPSPISRLARGLLALLPGTGNDRRIGDGARN